jgi:hypothetical protein
VDWYLTSRYHACGACTGCAPSSSSCSSPSAVPRPRPAGSAWRLSLSDCVGEGASPSPEMPRALLYRSSGPCDLLAALPSCIEQVAWLSGAASSFSAASHSASSWLQHASLRVMTASARSAGTGSPSRSPCSRSSSLLPPASLVSLSCASPCARSFLRIFFPPYVRPSSSTSARSSRFSGLLLQGCRRKSK